MSQPQAGELAALRVFFAALYDPERLRESSIARDLRDAVGCAPESADFPARIRAYLDAAIATLDGRARTIIIRCDLANEKNRAVAAELGIGERYFYRERRRASEQLLVALREKRAATEATFDSEPVEALVGAALALHNAGRSGESIGLLTSAYAGESSPRLRLGLAVQLARFAADSTRPGDVRKWTARGRLDLEEICDSPDETAIARCELELVEIRADSASTDYDRAAERARAVQRRLSTMGTHRHRDRVTAALAAAYLSLSEAEIMRGAFVDGLVYGLEGQANVERLSTLVPTLDVEARVAVAQARFFATCSIGRAIADFGLAYSRAAIYGLGRDVAKIASSLALLTALSDQPERSAAFSRTALTVGRRTLPGPERIDMSVDLAAAALTRRDVPLARSIVADVVPYAHGLSIHVLTMVEAEIALSSGELPAGLVSARRAGRGFEQHGNVRLLGSIQRIEAELLAASGQRSAAANRISDALDCLNRAGHLFSLSRAFALSARVTGNRRHRASANELQANLHAI